LIGEREKENRKERLWVEKRNDMSRFIEDNLEKECD
jgi:hypothetical protein